jgi:hypothetical protein
MNDQVQGALDSAQCFLEDVLEQRSARLAGTRVLQAFVMVLARQFLTEEQQQQVEVILDLHESCVRR